MEVTQFYLHLPSNASLDKFLNNTLTEYRVSLPQTISLTGDWEVALTEIHYPHSWNNVQRNFRDRFYLRDQELDGMWEPLIVPREHYSSVADLITKINKAVDEDDRFKDELQLSFDTLNRKVTVHLKNEVEVYFSDIGQMLGFNSRTWTAQRAVDLEHSLHDLYVYCDIIQSKYVGHALVPLLRIVPVEGKGGERISKSFIRPQYLPISRKQFETIEVNIKQDTGETVPFELGKVLLTLHFRQSRPVNFLEDEETSYSKSQIVRTVLCRSS